MKTIGKKIQDIVENFRLRFVGGVAFCIFLLQLGPMLTKTKNTGKKSPNVFFISNKSVTFCHMQPT